MKFQFDHQTPNLLVLMDHTKQNLLCQAHKKLRRDGTQTTVYVLTSDISLTDLGFLPHLHFFYLQTKRPTLIGLSDRELLLTRPQ